MLLKEFKAELLEIKNVARISVKESNFLLTFTKESEAGEKALVIEKIKNILTLDICTAPLKIADKTITLYLDETKLIDVEQSTVEDLHEAITTIDKPEADKPKPTVNKGNKPEPTADKLEAKKAKSFEAIKAFELVEGGKVDEIKQSSNGLSVGDTFVHPKVGLCTVTKCYAPFISKGLFNGRDYIDYTFLVAGKKKVGNTSASMLVKHKENYEALTDEQRAALNAKALVPIVEPIEPTEDKEK